MGNQAQGGTIPGNLQSSPQGIGVPGVLQPPPIQGYNAITNPAGFDTSMMGGAVKQQLMQPGINAALSAPSGQGPNITDLVRGVGNMSRPLQPGGTPVGPAAGKGK